MNRIVLWALLMTTTMLAAQTQIAPAPPAPQSARQALLEMFLGQGPDHLKKHLPEITKKAFGKIESGATRGFLTQIRGGQQGSYCRRRHPADDGNRPGASGFGAAAVSGKV